jgi:hypothetical protein
MAIYALSPSCIQGLFSIFSLFSPAPVRQAKIPHRLLCQTALPIQPPDVNTKKASEAYAKFRITRSWPEKRLKSQAFATEVTTHASQ